MPFDTNCFINCPFDKSYTKRLLKPIAFTVLSMGFNPQVSENTNSGGKSRIDYITELIKDSKIGIHDLSRLDLSEAGYPRFNMPFELGLDMGIQKSGIDSYQNKVIYFMDEKSHRYNIALSDIAGFDPVVIHGKSPEKIVRGLREAFYKTFKNPSLPTGTKVWLDYMKSISDIRLHLDISDIDFKNMQISEYSHWVSQWLSGLVPVATI